MKVAKVVEQRNKTLGTSVIKRKQYPLPPHSFNHHPGRQISIIQCMSLCLKLKISDIATKLIKLNCFIYNLCETKFNYNN